MVERRKEVREGTKKITLKESTVAKIIFYKYWSLPIITALFSFLFLTFTIVDNYMHILSLNKKISSVKEQIQNIKQKEISLKKQNSLIVSRLARTNSYLIDTQKVSLVVNKVLNLLKLKKIISDVRILSIENDKKYQNVANVTLEVFSNSKYLDTHIIKDILKVVLNNIFYIKSISLENNQIIKIQIYKKV